MEGTLDPRSDSAPEGCPRCGHPLPVGYPGALSRFGNFKICSLCGTDEAMRQFRGRAPVRPQDWPLRGADLAERIEIERFEEMAETAWRRSLN